MLYYILIREGGQIMARNMDKIEQALAGTINTRRDKMDENYKRVVSLEEERLANKEKAKIILVELDREVICLSEHTNSYRSYNEFVEKYYNTVKKGFEYKFFREHPIRFKFKEDSEDIYELQFRHFITNIMLWTAAVYLEPKDLDESHIVDCTQICNDLIDTYLNQKVVSKYQHILENKEINIAIHDTKFNLGRVSTDFNTIMGITINAETFIDLSKRIPEFDETLSMIIGDDLQPSQIEEKILELNERQIQLIREDKEFNAVKMIFNSGEGIKKDQFKELVVNSGLKPDLSGATVPASMRSNFLKHGLNDLLSYSIDAIGGRKPLVVNATDMGTMGHLSRLLSLSTGNFILRKDNIKDCGTVNSLRIFIRDIKILAMFAKRYYRLPQEFKYKVLRGDEEELIGREIIVRTPAKCASFDEEGVCHKCYGDLYYTNKDLERPGILAAKQTAEPIMQNTLSTKHLNTTDSDDVVFNEKFEDYFEIKSNEIILNPDADFAGIHLLIKKVDLTILEESDTGIDSYLQKFYIVDTVSKEVHCIEETNENILYLTPSLKDEIKEYVSTMRKGRSPMRKYVDEDTEFIEIPLGRISINEVLFIAEIRNNASTKVLSDIRYMIEYYVRRKELGVHDNIDGIIQKTVEMIVDSGVIPVSAIQVEVVFSMFIRHKDDDLARPDFRRYDADENTKVLTLGMSLMNNPSPTVSLSYQDYRRQFRSEISYRKTQSSYLDSYFRKVPKITSRD